MNQLNLTWTKDSLHFLIGDQEVIKLEVAGRHDHGERRRPRNMAVRITTIAQFSPNYNPQKNMSWKETIEVLRKYGADKEEIARMAHMGYEMGWTDIEEIMLYNGQDTFL